MVHKPLFYLWMEQLNVIFVFAQKSNDIFRLLLMMYVLNFY